MTVKKFIKIANIYNEIIDIWAPDTENYEKVKVYSGMEWEMLKTEFAYLTFDRLMGVIPESLYDSDHINIVIKEPFSVVQKMHSYNMYLINEAIKGFKGATADDEGEIFSC